VHPNPYQSKSADPTSAGGQQWIPCRGALTEPLPPLEPLAHSILSTAAAAATDYTGSASVAAPYVAASQELLRCR